jgi:hypothetical protein
MIWVAALGSNLSAYFILAANSWMQHPVGYRINPVTHRAQLTSIWKVLTNSTVLAALPHVFFAGLVTAGVFVVAASAWHLARRSGRDTELFRRAAGALDGLPAADEDGRRGSPLQHLLVGLVLTVHGGHAERQQPAVGRPGA